MVLQEDNNIAYVETQLDKAGRYVVKRLNPLGSSSGSIPWVTKQQVDGNVAVQGYSKSVWAVDGFNTRITQNETEISLVANSAAWNSAELLVQAGQISAAVTDINENYSLIAQNATNITLEVLNRAAGDAALQSSITINSDNINLRVQKNDVINQINISNESVRISANRLYIDGTTTFASNYDPTTKETPSGAQAKVNTLASSLWNLAYDNLVSAAQLDTTIISWGYIKTSLLEVNDIFSQNITANGTITWVEFKTSNNADRIEIRDDEIHFYESGTRKARLSSTLTYWNIEGVGVLGDIIISGRTLMFWDPFVLDGRIRISQIDSQSTVNTLENRNWDLYWWNTKLN